MDVKRDRFNHDDISSEAVTVQPDFCVMSRSWGGRSPLLGLFPARLISLMTSLLPAWRLGWEEAGLQLPTPKYVTFVTRPNKLTG